MTYFTKVFGCQMNQSDAERIATIFHKYKFKKASSVDEADFVVFVTCGVRQSAEDRVYGQVNNIRKKYPNKKIVLTGCLAHRKDVQRRLKNKVDLFTGINDFPEKIVSCIKYHVSSIENKKIQNTLYTIHYTKNKQCNDYLKILPKYTNAYTAYVPIMTGCNNFCAYCVVPYARGREYSRSVEDILREVKALVKKGYKEIILLGQNVNSYNSKLHHSKLIQNSKFKIQNSNKINFSDLLKLINAIPGNFWLTFLTSHPKDMSDELIETIAKSQKICEYISLPAQAGDNKVLARMNRKYTIEHYQNLIKKIHKAYSKNLEAKLPSGLPPAISTDIIVGFPGETKKQFENSVRLLRNVKFDMTYIAQYSPRPETAAWKMKDNVSKKEKVRREKILTEILTRTALQNNKKYIGKTVEVLVDASPHPNPLLIKEREPRRLLLLNKEKAGMRLYQAHTRTQKKVIFNSNKKIPIGSFAKVRITKAKAFGLEGIVK